MSNSHLKSASGANLQKSRFSKHAELCWQLTNTMTIAICNCNANHMSNSKAASAEPGIKEGLTGFFSTLVASSVCEAIHSRTNFSLTLCKESFSWVLKLVTQLLNQAGQESLMWCGIPCRLAPKSCTSKIPKLKLLWHTSMKAFTYAGTISEMQEERQSSLMHCLNRL